MDGLPDSRTEWDSIDPLPAGFRELLKERKLVLATAESCTGGLLGEQITRLAGSSQYYWGGVVVYDNRAKTRLLDVPAELLETHGAVSSPVAAAMAQGLGKLSGATVAVSVTGIAGPGGGTAEKPVGLVHCGLLLPGPRLVLDHRVFSGDRMTIRQQAALWIWERLQVELLA